MKIDTISDIHLDFWVSVYPYNQKNKELLEKFVLNGLPNNPSQVLLIAGDLGHYNNENALLIRELKKYYEHILIVPGNHDYYMITNEIMKKYENNSMKRWQEMKTYIEKMENCMVLDGNTIEIDGVVFGGTGGWYDFSYGIKHWNRTVEDVEREWSAAMNDSNYIKGEPTNVIQFSDNEKQKLFNVIEKADVIMTHVPPLIEGAEIPYKYRGKWESFYYMDIGKYANNIKKKIWLSGHVHERSDNTYKGCRFINSALGYPMEFRKEKRPIVTIEI